MSSETDIEFMEIEDAENWVPPGELPDLSSRSVIAIDLETSDPNLRKLGPGWPRGDGKVVGIAVAADGWQGYLPIAHEGGGNMDKDMVLRWLQAQLKADNTKVYHNAQYDMGWLKQMGMKMNGGHYDTMMAASLIDENRMSYSLNAVSYDWLGKTKSEKLLKEAAKSFGLNPKSEMWRMPAMFVGPYAEGDATLALELYHYIRGRCAAEQLEQIVDMEMRLLPMLVDMTMRGIRVDLEKADEVQRTVDARVDEMMLEIETHAGFEVSVWAANDIARAADKLGIEFPRTEKGAPSFTKEWLTAHPHKFMRDIAEVRRFSKVAGTFVEGIKKHEHNGRIHSHINQVRSDDGGTVTGRMSMSNPNLQQIPARDPILGPMIRGLFLPEEGCRWGTIDYSQQEPRLTVHYADMWGQYRGRPLSGVSEIIEYYREDPNADFHQLVADITDIERKPAKEIGLGTVYGMGIALLAKKLGCSFDEAKALRGDFNKKLPFIKELSDAVKAKVEDPRGGGKIRTLLGRVCRFDQWEPAKWGRHKAMAYEDAVAAHGPHTLLKRAYTYKALNKLIQGSAADQTKMAMVNLYEEGVLPMLQVHDDLNFSYENVEDLHRYRKIMEDCVELSVPVVCDIEVGDTWGQATEKV